MDKSKDKKTVISMPMGDAEHGNKLSKGYVLQGRYVIAAQLGAGGFGITYLAKHRYLEDIWVAIKEYLPDGAATRDSGSRVRVVSARYKQMYSWGLHRFLDEARLLGQFSHPNIVSVQDFFESNNTAYLVMDYVHGRSMQAELDGGRVFDEDKLRSIVYPLLDALQCIHHEGLYHRDISPDNILLKKDDDTPVLIDFGSARYAMRMHGAEHVNDGQVQTPTAIFKPGYSPIEQYESTDQGPYTDIYALGATLYRTALGTRPADALKRSGELRQKKTDPLEPASEKGRERFSVNFLKAIDAALHLEAEDRPQTINAWLDIFGKPPQEEIQRDRRASGKPFWRSPKVLASAIALMLASVVFALLTVERRYTIEDIPALLSEAGMELGEAPFSTRGLDSAGNLYLQVLTLEQENTRALSGYSATTILKQFSSVFEENDLGKAAILLDKAETELLTAGIEISVLEPGKNRLKLRNSEAALRRVIIRQPLSADTWPDITLRLDDMATLQDGEASAETGRRGLEALKATTTALQENDFDAAWSHIAEAEQQLSSLGITELQIARTQILKAQKDWQAARDAEVEALLTTAEQHLNVQPLTTEPLQQALQAYQAALVLDPEQPRARAGRSITNSLLQAIEVTDKGDFSAADKILNDARQAAGNTILWNGALAEARRQLAAAQHAWSVTETRSSAMKLRAQAADRLLAAPFDADTLSQAGRLLHEAQELSREMPELEAETKAAAAGSELVVLLHGNRALLNSAEFVSARNRMQSKETRTLSNLIGLGQPFIAKAGQSISTAEIEWCLSRTKALLSEDLLSNATHEKARQRLQRAQALDAEHSVAKAAISAIDSLHDAAKARQGHEYDTAANSLLEARPPLVALGVSAGLFEEIADSMRNEQQAWEAQQRENTIASKLSAAISVLEQQPFDSTAWQKSESLFDEVSTITGGRERAISGKSMLNALKSAKEASGARQFSDAQAQITLSEKILKNIGTGRFDKARNLINTANREWKVKKQKLIVKALVSAEQILSAKDPTADVLQQTRQAYQTALDLDNDQKLARAGLAVIASLEVFLQALQADDFHKAEKHLAEAVSIAKSEKLSPGLLRPAESLLSTDRDKWQADQARQEILLLQQRVSELLGQGGNLDQRLAHAEKALQEAVVLSLPHQGLKSYTTQSNAGLEAIILLRAVKGEIEHDQFDAAKETLSDIHQRLKEAKLDPAILHNLSQSTVSAEIDWLLADAARALKNGFELVLHSDGVDKAEKNYTAVRELNPEHAEIESALQSIATLRQMTVEYSQRDYDQAMQLLDQATTELSGVGIVEDDFDAIRQRFSHEQQVWKRLTLERVLNALAGEAINALNRSPFDDTTWQTVASLVEKIESTSANDKRGLAIKNALNNMRRVKQVIDEKRFDDAQPYIDEARSQLAAIGVQRPLKIVDRQLHKATSNALQTQLMLSTAALQESPTNEAALDKARSALEPVLTFLPDNPLANMGIDVIDLILAADAAITTTEFAKSAKLLNDADRQLKSIETSDPPIPQLGKALLDARRRLTGERPSPSEIYPLISIALDAISYDPLSTDMLDTANKFLHNVLAIQSDEPTALACLQAVDQLRTVGSALAGGEYANARAALEQVEKSFADLGLKRVALAPAWQALEAAKE